MVWDKHFRVGAESVLRNIQNMRYCAIAGLILISPMVYGYLSIPYHSNDQVR